MASRRELAEEVLHTLREWRSKLEIPDVDRVYVFGSLIDDNGERFDRSQSDVDLVVTYSQDIETNLIARIELCEQFVAPVTELKTQLRVLLGRNDGADVLSVNLVTSSDTGFNIHKGGAPDFFDGNEFEDLADGTRAPISRSTNPDHELDALADDGAIDCLRGAQRARNAYLDCHSEQSAESHTIVPETWDSNVDPLPKELTRPAGKLCFMLRVSGIDDDAPLSEKVSIDKGLSFLADQLEERGHDHVRIEQVRSLVELGRGRGRESDRRLTSSDYLLCWEILADEAVDALGARRDRKSGRPRQLVLADPVHRSIKVHQMVIPVLQSPPVQRLALVGQLPYCHAFATSASHTRLSHSLGTAHLAERAVRRVLDRGWLYLPDERLPIHLERGHGRRRAWQVTKRQRESLARLAFVAGLVHDVGHGPFAHALDRVVAGTPGAFRRLREHEDSRIRSTTSAIDKFIGPQEIQKGELARAISAARLSPASVAKIVAGKHRNLRPWEQFVGQVVDSDVDVDRIDYLLRDGLFTAYPIGRMINSEALLDSMRPYLVKNAIKLTFDETYRSFLEQIVLARALMYFHVYENSTKLSGERLVQRLAIGMFKKSVAPEVLARWTDAEFLEQAENFSTSDSEINGCLSRLKTASYAQYLEVGRYRIGQGEGPSALASAWVNKPDATAITRAPELERLACRKAGLAHERADVLVLFPLSRTVHGKKPPEVSMLRGVDGGKFDLRGLNDYEDELLSSTRHMIDPRMLPPKDTEETAVQYLDRYNSAGNPTGVSMLSILGRARSRIIVLVHSEASERQRREVAEWAARFFSEGS